jgi:hypothetical protein
MLNFLNIFDLIFACYPRSYPTSKMGLGAVSETQKFCFRYYSITGEITQGILSHLWRLLGKLFDEFPNILSLPGSAVG